MIPTGSFRVVESRIECFDGKDWLEVGESPWQAAERLIPNERELTQYPSLKSAWEEYLITRRLLGL